MKRLIKLVIIAITTTTLFAGGGHSHDANGGHGHSYQAPVNKIVAKEKAVKVLNSLIKKDIIDKSWSSANIDTAKKKTINGNEEWIVVFINNKIDDKKKQKLYVFLTPSGKYIASNYTGN